MVWFYIRGTIHDPAAQSPHCHVIGPSWRAHSPDVGRNARNLWQISSHCTTNQACVTPEQQKTSSATCEFGKSRVRVRRFSFRDTKQQITRARVQRDVGLRESRLSHTFLFRCLVSQSSARCGFAWVTSELHIPLSLLNVTEFSEMWVCVSQKSESHIPLSLFNITEFREVCVSHVWVTHSSFVA